MGTQTLTQGKLGGKVVIERQFDIEMLLVPPVETLYDIRINLQTPTFKEYDILVSVVREFETELPEILKKADSPAGFVFSTKSNINPNFTNLVFLDSGLISFVDISKLTGIPHGTFSSVKTAPSPEYQSLPVSDRFVIVDCSQFTEKVFKKSLIDGMLFIKFKHSLSSHPSSHESLLNFFDTSKIQYISYVDGTNVPTNIDENYASYYIGYLYIPAQYTLTFAVDGDDACEIEVDGQVVASWYGGHGFSNNPNSHKGTITLQPGWHKIIVRHEEICCGDGVRAYIQDLNGTTYYELTKQNILSHFPGFKLKVPFYTTKDEIVENLFINPPSTITDSIGEFLEDSSIILFKTLSENKELLEELPTLETPVDYTINLVSGVSEGSDITLLQNNEMLKTTEGVSFKPDTSNNVPEIELIFSLPTYIEKLYMFIAPTFKYPYYNYPYDITVKFYTGDTEDDVVESLLYFIDVQNSINICNYQYNGVENTYKFKFKDQNQVTVLKLQSRHYDIKLKKIKLHFADKIGTFKLLTPTKLLEGIKVIDYPNKILTEIHKDTIVGIPYDELNLSLLQKAKITKSLSLLTDYIAFSKNTNMYRLKLTNLPVVYTIHY